MPKKVSYLTSCINFLTNGEMTIKTTPAMCLMLALPIKSKIRLVAPVNKAVDRFAGAIKAQIITTGAISGKNPDLNCLIVSCLLLNCLLKYINNASLARSEV